MNGFVVQGHNSSFHYLPDIMISTELFTRAERERAVHHVSFYRKSQCIADFCVV